MKIGQLKVPSSFEDDVSQRNLSHYIHNFGHEAMTEFFNRIDEGEFHFSAWLSIPPIRAAAKEAVFGPTSLCENRERWFWFGGTT